jgi:hypothetical protein
MSYSFRELPGESRRRCIHDSVQEELRRTRCASCRAGFSDFDLHRVANHLLLNQFNGKRLLRHRITLNLRGPVSDFMGETWARLQLKKSKLLISVVGAVGIEPTTSPV